MLAQRAREERALAAAAPSTLGGDGGFDGGGFDGGGDGGYGDGDA